MQDALGNKPVELLRDVDRLLPKVQTDLTKVNHNHFVLNTHPYVII